MSQFQFCSTDGESYLAAMSHKGVRVMYSNNFVVCIIVNGHISEETKDGIITLPFDTEYKIRVRNKHNRRAVAQVFVDDENVSLGGVVVNGNSFVDIDGPVGKHVNFRFVSAKSEAAIDAGKNNKTDGSNGVIRVEWRLEKERIVPTYVAPRQFRPITTPSWPPQPPRPYEPTWIGKELYANKHGQSRGMSAGPCGQSVGFAEEEYTKGLCSFADSGEKISSHKEGCTVEGSYSNQNWSTQYVDLENCAPTIIRIVLRGIEPVATISGEAYTQVTGSTSVPHCENCGAKAKKKKAKFCWQCGNRLQWTK